MVNRYHRAGSHREEVDRSHGGEADRSHGREADRSHGKEADKSHGGAAATKESESAGAKQSIFCMRMKNIITPLAIILVGRHGGNKGFLVSATGGSLPTIGNLHAKPSISVTNPF
jgi:hypothetical protein